MVLTLNEQPGTATSAVGDATYVSTAPVLAAPAKVLAAPIIAPAPAVLSHAYAAPAPLAYAAAPLVKSYAAPLLAPAPLAYAATKSYGALAPFGLTAPYGLASEPYAYSSAPLFAAPALYKSSYGLAGEYAGYRK